MLCPMELWVPRSIRLIGITLFRGEGTKNGTKTQKEKCPGLSDMEILMTSTVRDVDMWKSHLN